MTSYSSSAMPSGVVGLALVLAFGAVAPSAALDIGIGGISVSVGIDSGLDVGIGVGSTAEVSASVGPAGVSAGIDLGTSTGGSPTNPDQGTSNASASGPSRGEVQAASRRECVGTGNSSVYDNFIVYDRAGLAVGVVKSANVGADLQVQRLTLATLESFAKPAECLTLSDQNVQIGAGAMKLSLSGNVLLRAIASR